MWVRTSGDGDWACGGGREERCGGEGGGGGRAVKPYLI